MNAACDFCGSAYTRKDPRQKYCSDRCANRVSSVNYAKRKNPNYQQHRKTRTVRLKWHGQHLEITDMNKHEILKVLWLRDYDFDQIRTYSAALDIADKMNWKMANE